MKSLISIFVFVSAILLFTNCATSYKSINPPTLNFTDSAATNNVEFSYKFKVLQASKNKRYSRKELDSNLRIIAVKLTNNTKDTINIRDQIDFYQGDKRLFPLDPYTIENSINQVSSVYLTYLLLCLLRLKVDNGEEVINAPIGLIIGPVISMVNIGRSNGANAKLFNELTEYNVLDKKIASGETIYGLIGVNNIKFDPISIKVDVAK